MKDREKVVVFIWKKNMNINILFNRNKIGKIIWLNAGKSIVNLGTTVKCKVCL